MSLVNEMLRDLDRRKRVPVDAGGAPRFVHEEGEQERKNLLPWLILLLIGGIVIGILATVWLGKEKEIEIVPTSQFPIAQPQTLQLQQEVPELLGVIDDAPRVQASILRERSTSDGFSLTIQTSEPVSYDIISRQSYGINILLTGVLEWKGPRPEVEGVSFVEGDEGLSALIELDKDAEFKVFENNTAGNYTVVIEASWNNIEAITDTGDAVVEAQAMSDSDGRGGRSARSVQEIISGPDVVVPAAVNERDQAPQIRTVRELSNDELDRRASQNALRQVQSGELQTAYSELFQFVAQHPQAHQSRLTLATLLFAQQDYQPAAVIIDEGLELAPNFAGYKKIKARLMHMSGDTAQAISLLENVPPVIAEDQEYHELLASLYQKLGRHDEAIEQYQELIRNDFEQGRYWVGLGVSLEATGYIEQAVNSFQVAIDNPVLDSGLRQYSQNRVRNLRPAP